MAATWHLLLCYLLVFSIWFRVDIYAETNSQDDQWGNTPPSWDKSNDPCAAWEGIICSDSRVTSLGLSTMGLAGKMTGDIGGLSELVSLDLSYNPGLTGPLSPQLGDLQKLTILVLVGCSFTNSIPSELGNLSELTFLALNSNKLSGTIPSSLGKLSKLYWLDLADNQLSGKIPVSSSLSQGLDQLKQAKHFHFNKNQLSGEIPIEIFSGDMSLIHVLLDGNKLEGNIPSTVGSVQTLEAIRLDRNSLKGSVPSNLNNLTNIIELNLAHNMLSGALPNLTGLNSLNYV
ncbi:Non-specific serine/threonine protein kinase [Handroanthus impetiginosus]|uniref:Non-specific serine/threonine protein kinase n=1 Tax=Handroanthus impetiginosus TaxID=429701 RepID=A0A2G9H9F2_9LAMI|nr:Non-specific serine/threonine protein kinase [Handroanthus impetiginosus]